MTACTERHFRKLLARAAGEGQQGMRQFRKLLARAAGEGQQGQKEGTA